MTVWRIHGHVVAKRRSGYGLHVVLYGRRIEFCGFHRSNVPYPLVLCRDIALGDALEAQLRVYDRVHMAGVIERRTRSQAPIIKRDWDMVVTEARIPSFSNLCRRLWTCHRCPNGATTLMTALNLRRPDRWRHQEDRHWRPAASVPERTGLVRSPAGENS